MLACRDERLEQSVANLIRNTGPVSSISISTKLLTWAAMWSPPPAGIASRALAIRLKNTLCIRGRISGNSIPSGTRAGSELYHFPLRMLHRLPQRRPPECRTFQALVWSLV
jgi:hypothetical protein